MCITPNNLGGDLLVWSEPSLRRLNPQLDLMRTLQISFHCLYLVFCFSNRYTILYLEMLFTIVTIICPNTSQKSLSTRRRVCQYAKQVGPHFVKVGSAASNRR